MAALQRTKRERGDRGRRGAGVFFAHHFDHLKRSQQRGAPLTTSHKTHTQLFTHAFSPAIFICCWTINCWGQKSGVIFWSKWKFIHSHSCSFELIFLFLFFLWNIKGDDRMPKLISSSQDKMAARCVKTSGVSPLTKKDKRTLFLKGPGKPFQTCMTII